MKLILFFSFFFIKSLSAIPLDSCRRIGNCEECVNSTDAFGDRCEWCISGGSCNSISTYSCQVDDTTLHSYNCPKNISDVKFDEKFMRNIVTPMIAATHSPDNQKLRDSLETCFNSDLEIVNTYEIFCDETNITTCFGYTAKLKSENALVLVFRGTTTLFQLIDEGISFFLHRKVKFEITKGVVDGYYLNAFNKIWENGMRDDFEKIYEENPNIKFWFFGHSLGGGLASIASSFVTKVYNLKTDQVKLVTFGMPRIGDIDLAIAHDQLVPDSLRIEHSKDPIPALPPRTFPDSIDRGSFHHRLEVWYPNEMTEGSKFILGSRPDTTVGRSVFPFNIEDHFRYFDVFLETWWIKASKMYSSVNDHSSRFDATIQAGMAAAQGLTNDQISAILDDETALENFIVNLSTVRCMSTDKESALASNKSLAEWNLAQRDRLENAKAQTIDLFDQANRLKSEVQTLKSQLDSVSSSKSLDTTSSLMQVAAQEADDDAESLLQQFENGEISIEIFLKQFKEKKTLAHLRKIKSDRLTAILREQTYAPPPLPQTRQQQMPVYPMGNHMMPSVPFGTGYTGYPNLSAAPQNNHPFF
ncbi:unnamed protein product [Caenorhabditis angaria]|uniref:VPS37 C-terminal domain-containing protein n=1 Tax=Caenorhabditis angaria TaxID=860376 RepID=A0A9P1IUN1_9PELO|nr:unnamed protein product [Caenorhabditis angaria]